jgi:proteasome-associated ATPase
MEQRTCEDLLAEAKKAIGELEGFIDQLLHDKLRIETITAGPDKEGSKLRWAVGEDIVFTPKKRDSRMLYDPGDLKPGVRVIVTKTGNVLEVLPSTLEQNLGEISTVLTVGKEFVELVDSMDTRFAAHRGELDLRTGDKVVASRDTATIHALLDRPPVTRSPRMKPLPWDSIGGLANVKKRIRHAIEAPLLQRGLFEKYGNPAFKGALLHGPPGNGKTLIGRAVASMLATKAMKGKPLPASSFMYIRGPELLQPLVGEAERLVREIFQQGRLHYHDHGFPAIAFIDEAEAILPRRGSRISSDVDKTIVPQFLSEMDGLDEHGPFVMLASNIPNSIDPAVLREGRIDLIFEVPPPDEEAVLKIFEIHLDSIPVCKGSSTADLCKLAKETFCSSALVKRPSGALIAGIAKVATNKAMERDIKAKRKNPSGVKPEDITDAVQEAVTDHGGK